MESIETVTHGELTFWYGTVKPNCKFVWEWDQTNTDEYGEPRHAGTLYYCKQQPKKRVDEEDFTGRYYQSCDRQSCPLTKHMKPQISPTKG